MAQATPINYATVAWAVQQINELLLASGQVLTVEVNEHNDITAAGVIDIQKALSVGFEPVRFVRQKPEVKKV